MRRITIGILIGVAAMLLVNLGRQQWRQWQLRDDNTYWEWLSKELPAILNTEMVFPFEMMSQQTKWPPKTSFDSIMVYQKTNAIKAIRIHAQIEKGTFTFPSAEEIRALDASAPSIPVPPDPRSNAVQTTYGSFLSYVLDTSLNSLTIRNRSGREFRKMTVVRDEGPTLTMKDLSDGSTCGTFIITKGEKTKVIRLQGHLDNGETFGTNFTVVVSTERKKNVDVEIDANLRFHVTEKDK